MLWLGVLLGAGSGLAQEPPAADRTPMGTADPSLRAEAERLQEAVMEHYHRGEIEEALALAVQSQALLRELVGEAHPTYAVGLTQLALLGMKLPDARRRLDLQAPPHFPFL